MHSYIARKIRRIGYIQLRFDQKIFCNAFSFNGPNGASDCSAHRIVLHFHSG